MGENLPHGKEATPALGVTTKYDGMWNLLPSPMLHRACGGASCADVMLLRQGWLARHAPVAPARFVGQSFYALLQKPLHPFVDKAAADPDRGGDVGNPYPIGHE